MQSLIRGAPLRIRGRTVERTVTLPADEGDPYLERLVKLIPSEIVALYLSFKGELASWLGYWAVVCLVLIIVVRAFATYDPSKGSQYTSIVLAVISFVVWVYATGGYFLWLTLPADWAAWTGAAVAVFTLLFPLYRGD